VFRRSREDSLKQFMDEILRRSDARWAETERRFARRFDAQTDQLREDTAAIREMRKEIRENTKATHDMREQIKANTQAVLRMLDKLDGAEGAGA
jgi:hypothetical protein